MEKSKGYRKQATIEAPKTLSDLSVLGNTICGIDNTSDHSKLPYLVAFGRAGHKLISEKQDYNQNNLISDLRASGCTLADSTIKHTLRAGKLLGDSDTRHFPLDITTTEIVKLMAVFGKLKPYQWASAYKLFKSDKLDNAALLAKFGIVVKKTATDDKEKNQDLNEDSKDKYCEVAVKHLFEKKIDLSKVIIQLEKTYGLCVLSSRINPEDSARDKVKLDLEKRTAQWLNGKTVQTIKDPLSGATVILDDGTTTIDSDESQAIVAKLVSESKARDAIRDTEKKELEKSKEKSKSKKGLNLHPAHKTENWDKAVAA